MFAKTGKKPHPLRQSELRGRDITGKGQITRDPLPLAMGEDRPVAGAQTHLPLPKAVLHKGAIAFRVALRNEGRSALLDTE